MSLGILLQRSDKDDIIPFQRSILAEILGDYAAIGENGEIRGMMFPDGERSEIFGAEQETITGLGFHHVGEKSLQMIWEIAERTKSYIFWPEGDPKRPHLVVTSTESLAELDPGIVDAIGPAVIAKNGEELDHLIFGEPK